MANLYFTPRVDRSTIVPTDTITISIDVDVVFDDGGPTAITSDETISVQVDLIKDGVTWATLTTGAYVPAGSSNLTVSTDDLPFSPGTDPGLGEWTVHVMFASGDYNGIDNWLDGSTSFTSSDPPAATIAFSGYQGKRRQFDTPFLVSVGVTNTSMPSINFDPTLTTLKNPLGTPITDEWNLIGYVHLNPYIINDFLDGTYLIQIPSTYQQGTGTTGQVKGPILPVGRDQTIVLKVYAADWDNTFTFTQALTIDLPATIRMPRGEAVTKGVIQ